MTERQLSDSLSDWCPGKASSLHINDDIAQAQRGNKSGSRDALKKIEYCMSMHQGILYVYIHIKMCRDEIAVGEHRDVQVN